MTRVVLLVLALAGLVAFQGWRILQREPAASPGEGLSLRFHGHAAFTITSPRGFHVLTDPYHEQAGLGPLDEVAEVITISHLHPDHSTFHPANKSATVLNGVCVDPRTARAWVAPIDGQFYDFEIRSFAATHATTAQPGLGPDAIFRIRTGGVTVVHLGDLGKPPAPEVLSALGPVDVLLVPVGGSYTLDAAGAAQLVRAIQPRLVVPMHAARKGLSVTLDPVEKFLATQPPPRRVKGTVAIKPAELPPGPAVLLFE